MQFFSHDCLNLNHIMKEEPEIRDLVLEHKEVFAVHNHEYEECYDCDWCDKCDNCFPTKGHLHPDCIRCIPEGFSKHPCETTQTLKQSFIKSAFDTMYIQDSRLIPEERKAHTKRLFKIKINQALMNLGLGETNAPVTGDWESAVVAPVHPIDVIEDKKDVSKVSHASVKSSELAPAQTNAPVTGDQQSAVVAPVHPIDVIEDNDETLEFIGIHCATNLVGL